MERGLHTLCPRLRFLLLYVPISSSARYNRKSLVESKVSELAQ